jgi:glycosyltransferase involved in cell wall biosynthesis
MSRIVYVQYTNPGGYPPLQHSSQMLADAGWQVLFLGTGAAGAKDLLLPDHKNISVRRMEFCRAGWRQKLHFLQFCLWVSWVALCWRPRWIYASDPLSCPIALLLTFVPGLDVIYHEHDSPSEPTPGAFAALIRFSRRVLARRAGMCILPNASRLERFRARLGPLRASACVWNCPATVEVASPPARLASDPLWLLYHGSIVPDRLPPTVIEALALLPDNIHLRIAGYETAGSRGYVARLLQDARTLHLDHRVEFLGSIPQRADLLAQALRSDMGLSLMPLHSADWNCETMTGASNKAFDYMACGLGLIVSDRPDWRGMFADPGYATVCDPGSAASIAAAVSQWIENPEALRQTRAHARQQILSGWNYETMFQPVFRLLSEGENLSVSAPRNADEAARPLV